MSNEASGYAEALAALSRGGVEFVLVGVGGINFYSRTPSDAYATLAVDALLLPATQNLRRALGVLSNLGYTFEAGAEPFIDITDDLVVGRIVQNGASLAALHTDGTQLDLMTSITGFDYRALADDAETFEVSGARVRVGRLEKLLRAKEVAGRPKDREFLRAFRARSEQVDPR